MITEAMRLVKSTARKISWPCGPMELSLTTALSFIVFSHFRLVFWDFSGTWSPVVLPLLSLMAEKEKHFR